MAYNMQYFVKDSTAKQILWKNFSKFWVRELSPEKNGIYGISFIMNYF
jgi:hypothetical protein